MADDRFFNLRFRREMKSMEISLSASVQRASASLKEIVAKLRVAGMSDAAIEENLSRDLEEGGRIFGEFRRAVRSTTEGALGKISTDAYLAEFGSEISYTWIAALVNTCVDCLPRHGEVHELDAWEAKGLPRSGWSVCKENCQCVLIPQEIAKGRNELRDPLDRRTAMAERRAAAR
jgi:hypothetical protein